MTSVASLLAPVEADLRLLADNLKSLVGTRHPILSAAAEHLFGAGGKRMRPAIVLLVSRATATADDITPRHRRLAEIAEMIHTASLVHDDVVDEAPTRRNVATVNHLFGNRVAVLAGDFLFAQSSWYLANLDNLDAVKLLSEVIRDFAEGEIQQELSQFDTSQLIAAYLQKSYFKTASLMANSAKAAGLLSGVSSSTAEQLYCYGRDFGLAFQIVDDILDLTASSEVLGKPAGSDLAGGNLTAPVLYALEEVPELQSLLARKLAQSGDLERAMDLVNASNGIARARELAHQHVRQAMQALEALEPSQPRQALLELGDYAVGRLY
jgi:all-trans-nonaprenyl-diphosphate synthase